MRPDTAIENSLMRAAQHQGQSPEQLEGHLQGLQELGLQPTEQTFNVLLRAHAAAGNLRAASEVMERMSAAGMHSTLKQV